MKAFMTILSAVMIIGSLVFVSPVSAQESAVATSAVKLSDNHRTIGLAAAAALAVAISILGASYAVARIGSAAMGALTEKPQLFARCILFMALAEGLAVLGFVIAIILIQKI